jgi:hypothetical protein
VRDAVDATVHEANALAADGEVVASRYPGAGTKLAVISARRRRQKPVSEETTKETVKTTAQGMPA